MTALLEKVIHQVESLPKDDQDSFAAKWLAELESEHRWDDMFHRNESGLNRLAAQALADIKAGKTLPIESLCEV